MKSVSEILEMVKNKEQEMFETTEEVPVGFYNSEGEEIQGKKFHQLMDEKVTFFSIKFSNVEEMYCVNKYEF